MDGRENIAVRNRYAPFVNNVFLVLFVALLIASIICLITLPTCRFTFFWDNYEKTKMIAIINLPVSIIMIIICAIMLVRFKMQPAVLIWREGTTLHFADGSTCGIEEVTSVNYSVRGYRYGVDSLEISVGSRQYNYSNVANPADAHKRITELMLKIRENDANI